MAKKVNAKNTKAEILSAFTELADERKALEKEVAQLNRELASAPRPPAPAIAQNGQSAAVVPPSPPSQPAAAPASAVASDLPAVLTNLDQLQVNFGSAAGNLSEQLLAEATKLTDLQAAIATETEQLAELHALTDITDETFDTLLQAYEEHGKTAAAEFEERQETLNQALADQQQAWQKEREAHRREVFTRDADDRKARERDETEHRYNLELARRLERETDERHLEQCDRELAEARQVQEKTWSEREQAIAERERLQAEAQAKVAAFPADLEQKIAHGKAEGKNIGHYQAKVKADLRRQESDGERQNYELRLAALDRTLAGQDERLQTLARQLDAALKQVQDLAVKAIEGSANQRSFDALKEVTLEQARNQAKAK